jgi:phage pi2 protein 07
VKYTSDLPELKKNLETLPLSSNTNMNIENITTKISEVAEEGDNIFAIVSIGRVAGVDSARDGNYVRPATLIALQNRLCLIIHSDKNLNHTIPYRDINSVNVDCGWITCDLIIKRNNEEWPYVLNTISHPEAKHFESWLVKCFQKYKKIEGGLLANEMENNLDYDRAITAYDKIGDKVSAKRVRTLKAEQGAVKVTQKVVHGDEVTNTEIKDSVLNRSNVGGGSSKAEELREAKSLFEEGLINENDYEQMKKEILGK